MIVLVVCDGWGVGASDPAQVERQGNAVAMARTPVRDRLLAERPWCLLETSGQAVGLPDGQMGNSEVGHLNLGAGRVVPQDATRISEAARDGSFSRIPALAKMAEDLRTSGGAVHLAGLCSDGGVHSHIDHLEALLEWADGAGLPIRIHCITDGRDAPPVSGLRWVAETQRLADERRDARIVTISGRYYAMDRDGRWERTEQAYRAIVEAAGPRAVSPTEHVARCYENEVGDEFLPPAVIRPPAHMPDPRPPGVAPEDGFIFFNFRADRARQLTAAVAGDSFRRFPRRRPPCANFAAMTRYEDDFPHPVLFAPRPLENVLGEALSQAGRTQLRTAETEKYPHVTYFFNGGVEEPFPGEERTMVPSPDVATYDLQPEMSAPEVTEALLASLDRGGHDFVLVNYANADMVGHTGSVPAAVAAVETVDGCVGRVLERIAELGGTALVTADHGNAEKMRDDDGRPFTAHTTFPVRLILCEPDGVPSPRRLRNGTLADVAPTILEIMGLPKPLEMTGRSLLRRSISIGPAQEGRAAAKGRAGGKVRRGGEKVRRARGRVRRARGKVRRARGKVRRGGGRPRRAC